MSARSARRTSTNAAPAAPISPGHRHGPSWQWRTFPVFFAFVVGMLIASFINGRPDNTAGALIQIVAILGFSYALIHLIVVNVIVAGRMRRRDEQIARGETPDDAYEDAVVYPDEP
ncbi:MAG TPA: hypothetical protein VIH21_07235 [Dehalococcoidia bacterium]